MARQKSKASIETEEVLRRKIGAVKNKIIEVATAAQMQQSMMNEGMSLLAPEPRVPFKVFVRPSPDGLFLTIDAGVPMGTDELRIITLDKRQNTLRDGESTEEAIARTDGQKKSYRVPVSAEQSKVGRVTAELKEPIAPRKMGNGDANAEHDSDDARAVQLCRLIALNVTGKTTMRAGSNPDMDPWSQGTFPITAFVVREQYDDGVAIGDMDDADKRYFTVGANFGPVINGPSLDKIICNRAVMQTSINIAFLTFQVNADDTNPNTTFADQNVREVILSFKVVNDPAQAMMQAGSDATPVKVPIKISDPTAKTVFGSYTFHFGVEYEWTKITYVTSNDEIAITATGIRFFAGGDGDLNKLVQLSGLTPGTNVAGQSDNAKLQLQVDKEDSDVQHTYFTVRLQQPGMADNGCTPSNRAVVFKRIRITEKRPQDGSYNVIANDPALDNNVFYFTPGSEIFARFKVPQRKRQSVLYRAEVVGLDGSILRTFEATVIGLPGSTNEGTPPDPTTSAAGAGNTADLVDNVRDGDTGRAKARFGLRIWSSLKAQQGDPTAPTFRQIKVDKVGARLRRQRNEDANDPMSLDEPTTRNRWYYGHIPESAQDSKSFILSVHNNHLGDKFIWDRVALGQSEVYMESPGVNSITFFAGMGTNAGSYDPTRLLNRTISAILINKRHSKIICGFDQGTVGSPLNPSVLIRRIDLWVKYPDQSVIQRLKGRSLKNIPEYSLNDPALTYTPPNTNIHKEVEFRIPHKDRIQANQIQVQFELSSFGGRSVFIPSSPMLIPYNTGNDEPQPCSTPMPADIILNTLVGDTKSLTSRLRFRVFASDAARTNPLLTFAALFIDSVKLVFGELNSSTALTHKTFDLTALEANSNFVDFQIDDFAPARSYSWIKSVSSNAGGHTPALSTNLNLMPSGTGFVAGGRIGTAGLPELGMISATRTEIDEKQSKVIVTLTQVNPPVLLNACRLQEQVVSAPNGYSEASYHKEDVVDLLEQGLTYQQFTGSPVTIELKSNHPRKATINLRVILVGVGDGNNKPTRVIDMLGQTTQDMILSPPSQNPSLPSYPRIVQNVLNFGAKNLKAKITLRVYANDAQNVTFAQVGADAAYVFIARTLDSSNEKRIKFGGPIKNTAQTFIDIECAGLDVGQLYDWLESSTSRNGLPVFSSSITGAIQFYAGNVSVLGSGGSSAASAFSSGFGGADFVVQSLVQKNPRFSKLTISLRQPGVSAPFQPNTASRLPVLVAGVLFEEQEGGFGTFDAVSSKELLLQPSFQAAGTSTSTKNFHHKKNQTMVYRATLMFLDGSSLAVSTSEFIPNRGDFDDEGLPGSLPSSSNSTVVRWNQRGLRIKFELPRTGAANMNTHFKCAIALDLLPNSTSNIFLWSPTQRLTQNVSGTGVTPANYPMNFPGFIEEGGKQGLFTFPTPAGVSQSINEFDNQPFNQINNNGGSINIHVYIFNKFLVDALGNPLPSSYSFLGTFSRAIGAGWVVDTS